MAISKKFILGIGSQRAGSTFLFKILNSHKLIELNPVKEIHYFDTFFKARPSNALKEFSERQLSRELSHIVGLHQNIVSSFSYRWYLYTNWILFKEDISKIKYEDIFLPVDKLDIIYTGEITPEYMLLTNDNIKKIKDLISAAYVILLCRNPIKRLLSAFRLYVKYNNIQKNEKELNDFFLELIENGSTWYQAQLRYGEYREALKKYCRHFSNVIHISFDEMFKKPEGTLKNISSFLDLNFEFSSLSKYYAKKFNSADVPFLPNNKLLDKLSADLQEQVDDVNDLFSEQLQM